MRLIVAIVLLAVSTVSLAFGVAGSTVFREPETIERSIVVDHTAPAIVIHGTSLQTFPGRPTITVESDAAGLASTPGGGQESRDSNQSRRLLSLAAVMDGMSRDDAARIGGMDRQTLRDWVHRFNMDGPDALLDAWTNGPTPRLSLEQRSELAVLVEAGPDRQADGVVPSSMPSLLKSEILHLVAQFLRLARGFLAVAYDFRSDEDNQPLESCF